MLLVLRDRERLAQALIAPCRRGPAAGVGSDRQGFALSCVVTGRGPTSDDQTQQYVMHCIRESHLDAGVNQLRSDSKLSTS